MRTMSNPSWPSGGVLCFDDPFLWVLPRNQVFLEKGARGPVNNAAMQFILDVTQDECCF